MTPQALLAAALRHHQGGQLAAAEQGYRAVLALDPRHADALHLLGVIAHQRGDQDAALRLITDAIAQNDRVAAFHNNHGNVLVQLGRHADAIAAYHAAIRLHPAHADAHLNLALALQAEGQWAEATAAFTQAVTLRPDNAEAHAGLAGVLSRQGQLVAALASIDRALTLRPRDAGKHANRGAILAASGRSEGAIAAYQRAIALDVNLPAAHNNLGLALRKQERGDDALACFRRATALAPDYADAYLNLGNTLQELGRVAEAAQVYRDMLARWPDRADAQLALAMTAIPLIPANAAAAVATPAAFATALDSLAAWAESKPGRLGTAAGTSQPFYLAYREADVTGALCRYGDLIAGDQPSPAREAHAGRVRLAIVSAHVRDHPVWRIILKGLIGQLDRSRFEVSLYHSDARSDEQTSWAARNVDHFVGGERATAAWQAELERERFDIILYPEVGMDPVTGALAAKRLAPVQAALWGHPITTGLPTIDVFFSGDLLEANDAERHYRERLVRLPGTGVSTDWQAGPAEPWHGPERTPGIVRFAICQQPIKFDPIDDALLPRIALQAGACEFWFVVPRRQQWAGEQVLARLRNVFAQAGLDPDRYVKSTPWLTTPMFNGFLDAMDIYLDCPAFSGFTTALQAAQRGLPIVTLEGRFLRQRLAAGLLRDLGMADGVVSSADAYVERAVTWATRTRDAAVRNAMRAALRDAASRVVADPAPVRMMEEVLLARLADG